MFLHFQFSVQATDQGSPGRQAAQQANVVVTVIRNTVGPVFSDDEYTVNIDQTQALTEVFDVDATDNSGVS